MSRLDPQNEAIHFMAWLGAALAGLFDSSDARDVEAARGLWRALPLVKAWGRLGDAHSEELLALYRQARKEKMPFGLSPLDAEEKPE